MCTINKQLSVNIYRVHILIFEIDPKKLKLLIFKKWEMKYLN